MKQTGPAVGVSFWWATPTPGQNTDCGDKSDSDSHTHAQSQAFSLISLHIFAYVGSYCDCSVEMWTPHRYCWCCILSCFLFHFRTDTAPAAATPPPGTSAIAEWSQFALNNLGLQPFKIPARNPSMRDTGPPRYKCSDGKSAILGQAITGAAVSCHLSVLLHSVG